MTAHELMRDLESASVRLQPRGERLRVEAPKGVLTQDQREGLKRYKSELLRLLDAEASDEDAREYIEERAAIAEYHGGLSRAEAESERVRSRVVAEYRREGDDRWLTVLGAPGQSYDELVESLQKRFGDVTEVRAYRRTP